MVIYEKSFPNDWAHFDSKSVLGASLAGQAKYAEAEPLLLSGYEGLTRESTHYSPGGRAARLPPAAGRIVQLYESWGKPEKAAEWRARAKSQD
jgi:hypothetical protein